MCHAPIVIPAIGAERARDCERTTRAMRAVAGRIVGHHPDVLVLVSPHTPRQGGLFGVVEARRIAGSFARFGFPHLAVRLPGAPDAAHTVRKSAAQRGVECWTPPADDLDHGALVPLHFLVEMGWKGATLVLALPYQDGESETAMGEALRAAADAAGERWAIVASGDMSHRLRPGAPAGFDPRAREFDAAFAASVESGDYRAACSPDPWLREIAAEDVVQSAQVAAAATGFRSDGHALFAYEGPFGVGYCESLLFTDGSDGAAPDDIAIASAEPSPAVPDAEPPPAVLPEIAREAIRAHRLGQPLVLPHLKPPWEAARAVFVTLRSRAGELRGCIGRTEPSLETLAEEIADCAVSSANRDPRCERVTLTEIDHLRIEVSVLSSPTPISSRAELDPRRYGVVVTLGHRRGVLLPDVEGVDSVAAQLRIAADKAGLRDDDPYTVERFEVVKVKSG
jgi:AmmeMemoRadiSam system protein A